MSPNVWLSPITARTVLLFLTAKANHLNSSTFLLSGQLILHMDFTCVFDVESAIGASKQADSVLDDGIRNATSTLVQRVMIKLLPPGKWE